MGLIHRIFLSCEGVIGHVLPPGAEFLPSGDGFLGRKPLSGDMGGRVLLVTLDIPSTSKFGHIFFPKSVGAALKAVVFSWENKFGYGSPTGSDILSSSFPSTSKFGHSFRPESIGEVLGDVVLAWEGKFEHGSPPSSDILSYGLPSTSKFGHSFRPESVG